MAVVVTKNNGLVPLGPYTGPYEAQLVAAGYASYDNSGIFYDAELTPAAIDAVGDPSARVRTRSLPRVATAGDSFYNFATNTNVATFQAWNNFSVINWLRFRYNDRMYTDLTLTFAVGGSKSDHLLNVQLPQILVARPDIVLVNDVTNDINQFTAAQSIANVKAFLAQTRVAGIGVVWNTVIPQSAWNNAAFKQVNEFNQQLVRLAGDPANRLWIADMMPVMVDFGTNYAIAGNLVADGVHPSIVGALAMETVLSPILDKLLPPSIVYPTYNVNDYFDATLNPSGNIIKGGRLDFTDGPLSNGATGNVARYWNGSFAASGGTTLTAAFSKSTATGLTNMPTQVITLGGTADGNSVIMEANDLNGNPIVVPAGINAGDKLQATFYVSWTGVSNLAGIQATLQAKDAGGTNYQVVDGFPNSISGNPTGQLPATRSMYILRTPPLVLATGFNTLRLRLTLIPFATSTAVSGVINIQQVSLRRL